MTLAGVRLLILIACILATVACSPRTQAAPAATQTPRPPTSTPVPDYRGMGARLLTPLGALIVAVRSGDPNRTAAGHLANFNTEADKILPAIERDGSTQANILHSAIVNVRAHPGDLTTLEQTRLDLVRDI